MVCSDAGGDETMLLCDGCGSGTHMECMAAEQRLEAIPHLEFYCSRCAPAAADETVDGWLASIAAATTWERVISATRIPQWYLQELAQRALGDKPHDLRFPTTLIQQGPKWLNAPEPTPQPPPSGSGSEVAKLFDDRWYAGYFNEFRFRNREKARREEAARLAQATPVAEATPTPAAAPSPAKSILTGVALSWDGMDIRPELSMKVAKHRLQLGMTKKEDGRVEFIGDANVLPATEGLPGLTLHDTTYDYRKLEDDYNDLVPRIDDAIAELARRHADETAATAGVAAVAAMERVLGYLAAKEAEVARVLADYRSKARTKLRRVNGLGGAAPAAQHRARQRALQNAMGHVDGLQRTMDEACALRARYASAIGGTMTALTLTNEAGADEDGGSEDGGEGDEEDGEDEDEYDEDDAGDADEFEEEEGDGADEEEGGKEAGVDDDAEGHVCAVCKCIIDGTRYCKIGAVPEQSLCATDYGRVGQRRRREYTMIQPLSVEEEEEEEAEAEAEAEEEEMDGANGEGRMQTDTLPGSNAAPPRAAACPRLLLELLLSVRNVLSDVITALRKPATHLMVFIVRDLADTASATVMRFLYRSVSGRDRKAIVGCLAEQVSQMSGGKFRVLTNGFDGESENTAGMASAGPLDPIYTAGQLKLRSQKDAERFVDCIKHAAQNEARAASLAGATARSPKDTAIIVKGLIVDFLQKHLVMSPFGRAAELQMPYTGQVDAAFLAAENHGERKLRLAVGELMEHIAAAAHASRPQQGRNRFEESSKGWYPVDNDGLLEFVAGKEHLIHNEAQLLMLFRLQHAVRDERVSVSWMTEALAQVLYDFERRRMWEEERRDLRGLVADHGDGAFGVRDVAHMGKNLCTGLQKGLKRQRKPPSSAAAKETEEYQKRLKDETGRRRKQAAYYAEPGAAQPEAAAEPATGPVPDARGIADAVAALGESTLVRYMDGALDNQCVVIVRFLASLESVREQLIADGHPLSATFLELFGGYLEAWDLSGLTAGVRATANQYFHAVLLAALGTDAHAVHVRHDSPSILDRSVLAMTKQLMTDVATTIEVDALLAYKYPDAVTKFKHRTVLTDLNESEFAVLMSQLQGAANASNLPAAFRRSDVVSWLRQMPAEQLGFEMPQRRGTPYATVRDVPGSSWNSGASVLSAEGVAPASRVSTYAKIARLARQTGVDKRSVRGQNHKGKGAERPT